jgi:TonB family protein
MYRGLPGKNYENEPDVKEGDLHFTVVPAVQATFPGGVIQMEEYLLANVTAKIPKTDPSDGPYPAVVSFLVDENGKVSGTRISQSSAMPEVDRILLDAFRKMPAWKPAEQPKGTKVKQQFRMLFGGGGC